jgi:hypothetical protein
MAGVAGIDTGWWSGANQLYGIVEPRGQGTSRPVQTLSTERRGARLNAKRPRRPAT